MARPYYPGPGPGLTTSNEHAKSCPALSAWDIPGACNCGYPLVRRCDQCGRRVSRDAKRCPHCTSSGEGSNG